MDLTNTTARELGAVLDRAGIKWEYDPDGDIKVQHAVPRPPWIDLVSLEIASDWSMRGRFLNARSTLGGDGGVHFAPPADGSTTMGPAAKVVDVYFAPTPGGVNMQVHATVAPLERPFHLAIMPAPEQVSRVERSYPRYLGTGDLETFFMAGGATGIDLPEAALVNVLREALQVGLKLFEGPFTGRAYEGRSSAIPG